MLALTLQLKLKTALHEQHALGIHLQAYKLQEGNDKEE